MTFLIASLESSSLVASPIPVVGQAVAGYDSYKQSVFERNVKKAIKHLNQKVGNLSDFFEI